MNCSLLYGKIGSRFISSPIFRRNFLSRPILKKPYRLFPVCFFGFICFLFVTADQATAQQYSISTFAGGPVPSGLPVLSTPVPYPSGVAVDGANNLYFSTANRVIYKVASGGVANIVAGTGNARASGDGGPATQAGVVPCVLAFDSTGNLYTYDSNLGYVRKIALNGTISTLAQQNGGGAAGIPLSPAGIVSDSAGNIYVTDGLSQIYKISPTGVSTVVAGIAPSINAYSGNGYSGDGGPALSATLGSPYALAMDRAGSLYIADGQNSVIRKITTDGIIHTIAGTGTNGYSGDGGPATAAQLNVPESLAIDSAGNIYIADTVNSRIRKIATAGIITTIAGGATAGFAGDGLPAANSLLNWPQSIALDSLGNLYIADTLNHRIRKISSGGLMSTVAGTGNNVYGDGGQALSAVLNQPREVAVDKSGNVLIGDRMDFRLRSVSPGGIITTVGGSAALGSYASGIPATGAQLGYIQGVTSDSGGNIYISEEETRVSKITSGGTIVTFAGGQFNESNNGDGGPATNATIVGPSGLWTDSAGNVYIADMFGGRVRKVSPNGIISTFAGTDPYGSNLFSGDGGPATSAYLDVPSGVAGDSLGNIFISDWNAVRQVSPTGIISTLAGTPTFDTPITVPGGFITNNPNGIAVDNNGNVIVSDTTNHIRRITPGGLVTTIAGNGIWGYSGDGGLAINARLADPAGVAVDKAGNIYVADTSNNVVRVLHPLPNPSLQVSVSHTGNFTQGQNGATYSITVSNASGAGPTVGDVYVSDSVPTGLTKVSMSGPGWICNGGALGPPCTRSNDSLSAGVSFPPITVTVNVSASAPSSVVYSATVSGGGSNLSTASDTTTIQPSCAYSLGSSTATFGAGGGAGSVAVSTGAGCSWTAASNAAWLTITASASGSGNGIAGYAVAANPGAQRTGTLAIAGSTFTVTQGAGLGNPASIGVFQGGVWSLDSDKNGVWDGSPADKSFTFSAGAGDIAVLGDWNGDGRTKIGVYHQGFWLLDYNGNGVWDGPGVDRFIALGGPGYLPVVGDWNGDGRTKVGFYFNGFWALDYNGNGVWDGPAGGDEFIALSYRAGETPVVGDWNGDGRTKVGVFSNGTWALDYNGNGVWDLADKMYGFSAGAGDIPVVGDWSGSHSTKIGVYHQGFWLLDYNGNGQWDGTTIDRFAALGAAGETPVVGDWNGSGTVKIGFYYNGFWALDYNGNFQWDGVAAGDRFVALGGSPGEQPVVGKW